MLLRGRHFAIAACLFIASLGAQLAPAKKKDKPAGAMDEQKRAVHALNRLTFGPRPGDVQRVAQMGVDKWIDLQLHPEKIDDTALDARLTPFRTLRMDTRELVENFPPNQVIRQVANGKADLPSDPTKRAVYEAQVHRYKSKKDRNANEDASKLPAADPAMASSDDEKAMSDDPQREQRQEDRRFANRTIQQLLDLPADQRLKEILKMPVEGQRALAVDLKGPKADSMMEGMSPQQKETLMALRNPERVVIGELSQGCEVSCLGRDPCAVDSIADTRPHLI